MADTLTPQLLDRLKIKARYEKILGVRVPKVTIPVAAGRNIAVLVEVGSRETGRDDHRPDSVDPLAWIHSTSTVPFM